MSNRIVILVFFAVSCLCFPPLTRADAPEAVTVPFTLLKTRHIVVEIKVNGKGPYRVIFDTGAPVMLLNNKVAKEAGLIDKVAKPSLFNPFGSMGQMKIKAFELGSLKANDLPTVVMDHPTVEQFSRFFGPIEGIVGFPFFARYKMTVDYQAKTLTFIANGYDPPDAMEKLMNSVMAMSSNQPKVKTLAAAAQWGVVLDKADNNQPGVRIKEVRPGSAAAEAGIKLDDRIQTVDGRWTDTIQDAYDAASYVQPGTEAKLVLQRGAERVELKIKPRRTVTFAACGLARIPNMKRIAGLTATALAAAVILASMQSPSENAPPNVGKKIPDVALKDTNGKTVALGDHKDAKAIVVVFLGTQCPINNLFAPRLNELNKEYRDKGVVFLGINSNAQDTTERIADHARKFELSFPVLKDEDNRVADQFGATRTPEAFVLDATRTIRYQGRIDDQFGIDYKRPQPTRRDLACALDEVLAGKTVSKPVTEVAGCFIGRTGESKAEGTVTYAKHIAPIIQNQCQECHRPGQIGPMPLMDYEDAKSWSAMIREVVDQRRMPPWHADPRFGKFSNDRSLSQQERATLLAWIDNGTPKGDDRDAPKPREFVTGWTIGKPDVVFQMEQEFNVPADAPKTGIPYKHFFVETNFTEDHWVERAEAVPGAPEVVHHIVVFIVPPKSTFFPGNPEDPVLTGTAPGDMPLILPEGTAKKIPAGSKLVLEMHYTPNGKAQKDRSSVGLIFAKEKPKLAIQTEPITNPFAVKIPPGDPNFQVEASWRFRDDGFVMSFMPHMHLRGKDFMVEAIYPDGKKETLLSVPKYNFNWQSMYRLKEPLRVPKGTEIHCVAHFDNSADNPNNPNPTKKVFWGDQTWEEMMIGWMDYAYDRPAVAPVTANER